MKKLFTLALAALTIGLLGSCEKEDPKVSVTGVMLDKTELTLTVGDPDVKLAATIAPENATDKTVSWSSDKTDFATVDNQGNVHAEAPGTANITVTTTDGGKTATCVVTVKAAKVSVTGVTLDKTTLEITVGDPDVKLTAAVAPENATDKTVSWSSDKTEFATVDNQGNVHAVAPGTATITVTTTDGGKTATCAVTVKESPLYEWDLLGTGLFTDDTVFPFYGKDPVTVPVKVYQKKTNQGLYLISGHSLQLAAAAFGVTPEEMAEYEGVYWRNADIILNASNLTSVKWELQDYGVCLNPKEGFFDGVTNMYGGAPYSKGTLSNGVISWPTPNGMLCTINGEGYYKADLNGKQAITLPSEVTEEKVEAVKAALKSVKPMKNISLIKADAQ